MNKTSLIGFILIAAILFGWMWWMQPSQEELAEQKRMKNLCCVLNGVKNTNAGYGYGYGQKH